MLPSNADPSLSLPIQREADLQPPLSALPSQTQGCIPFKNPKNKRGECRHRWRAEAAPGGRSGRGRSCRSSPRLQVGVYPPGWKTAHNSRLAAVFAPGLIAALFWIRPGRGGGRRGRKRRRRRVRNVLGKPSALQTLQLDQGLHLLPSLQPCVSLSHSFP